MSIDPATLAGCRQIVSWVEKATGSLNILWPTTTYYQIRTIRTTLASYLDDYGYGYKWRGQDRVDVVNGEAVHSIKFVVVGESDPARALQDVSRGYDSTFIIMNSVTA